MDSKVGKETSQSMAFSHLKASSCDDLVDNFKNFLLRAVKQDSNSSFFTVGHSIGGLIAIKALSRLLRQQPSLIKEKDKIVIFADRSPKSLSSAVPNMLFGIKGTSTIGRFFSNCISALSVVVLELMGWGDLDAREDIEYLYKKGLLGASCSEIDHVVAPHASVAGHIMHAFHLQKYDAWQEKGNVFKFYNLEHNSALEGAFDLEKVINGCFDEHKKVTEYFNETKQYNSSVLNVEDKKKISAEKQNNLLLLDRLDLKHLDKKISDFIKKKENSIKLR